MPYIPLKETLGVDTLNGFAPKPEEIGLPASGQPDEISTWREGSGKYIPMSETIGVDTLNLPYAPKPQDIGLPASGERDIISTAKDIQKEKGITNLFGAVPLVEKALGGLWGLGRTIITRPLASLGQQALAPFVGEKEFVPTTPTQKFIFGEEPIKPAGEVVTERTLKGIELGRKLGEKLDERQQGLIPSKTTLGITGGLIGAGLGLLEVDPNPFAYGEKAIGKRVLKTLAKETSEDVIKNILKKETPEITDEALNILAKNLKKIKTEKEVSEILSKPIGEIVEKKIPAEIKSAKAQQAVKQEIKKEVMPKRAKEITLKSLGLKEPAPFVLKKETTLLKDKIKNLSRGYREGRVVTKKEIKSVQTELTNLIKTSDLELKDKAKFISKIKNVQIQEQLQKILPKLQERISILEETTKKRNLLRQIAKELKESPTRKVGTGKMSKYSPEITKRLKEYKIAVSFKDPASLKMKKLEMISEWYAKHPNEYLPDKIIEGLQELDRKHLKLLSSSELEQHLRDIQLLKKQGKTYNRLIRGQTRRERKKIIDSFDKIITGGEPLEKQVVVPEHENVIKRALKKLKVFHYHQLNSDNLFDILDEATKGRPYAGKIHNYFQRVVNKSRDVELSLTNRDLNNIRDVIKKLGIEKNLYKEEKLLLKGKPITLTKNEMLDIYISAHDKAKLNSMIQGNGFTKEFIKDVIKKLTPQEKRFGDFVIQFHSEKYPEINNVFRKVYFMDMPKNEGYSPMHKDIRFTRDEDVNLLKEALEYAKASVQKGMTRARTGSLAPIKLDALGNFVNDITKANHYIAWELPVKEVNAVLSGIKDSVIAKYGPEYYDVLKTWLKRVAGDGRFDVTKLSRELLKLRTGLTKSLIANFITPLKQTISLSSFLTEMNEKDLISGVADYWSHKSKWDAFFDKVPQIASRSETLTRDIADIAKTRSALRTLQGKKQISELGVAPVRFFDMLTVRSGATAMYKKALKEGLTKEQALEKVLGVVRRTQPTGDIKDLSLLQSGGPLEKLLTMFMNQPNKYYNILAHNLRAYAKGRIGKKQLARAFLYAWVIPSVIFEEAGKGGKATKEDIVKAIVLGPLNDVLVLGNLFQGIRSGFDYTASPIEGLAKNFSNAMVKLSKGEVLASLYNLTKIAAQTKGIPVAQPERTIKGLVDITSGNTTDWRRLIWSKYALGENRRNVAKSYLTKWSKLPKEEAARKFDELKEKNPKMAKEILKVFEEQQLGITEKEHKLKTLGVDKRAKMLVKKFNKLKTNEEKARLWDEYAKKRIITKTVAEKLVELLKK